MILVTILLSSIFTTFYLSTKINYQNRCMETPSSALKKDYSKGTPAPKDPSPQKEAPPLKKNDRPPERSEFPVLVTALSFLNLLDEQAESSGVLKEYHLRYIVRHAPDGSIKYALADIYAEENASRSETSAHGLGLPIAHLG